MKISEFTGSIRSFTLSTLDKIKGLNVLNKFKNYAIYSNFFIVGLTAYFLGDIASLFYDNIFPPKIITNNKISKEDLASSRENINLDYYNSIFSRNIFNSNGIIPNADVDLSLMGSGGPSSLTSLPIKLIGTIVFNEELKSLAAIEDKTKKEFFAVRVNDKFNSFGKIQKIEKLKVYFYNTISQRNEYVEIKQKEFEFSKSMPGGASSGYGITKTSSTSFVLDRGEIDSSLQNFNKILTESRVVPDPSGGWKIFQIVPGSIYDKIGLKNEDVLCGFNGQNIDDPSKAFEMLNELKNASHIEVCVKRNGKQFTNSYDIK